MSDSESDLDCGPSPPASQVDAESDEDHNSEIDSESESTNAGNQPAWRHLQAIPPAQTGGEVPRTVGCSLTKNSYKGAIPTSTVTNIEQYKNCMMIDKEPGASSKKFYNLTTPAHKNEDYNDGSAKVAAQKALDVLSTVTCEENDITLLANVKGCLNGLANATPSNDACWKGISVQIHVPQMALS